MIFTQQLHQCHGLVNVGLNSLSVPVQGGVILLCITHVCDCYLSSILFSCGWYQVVSSTLSRFMGSFPWSLLTTAQSPTIKSWQEWNQMLKDVCYLAGVIMWHITCPWLHQFCRAYPPDCNVAGKVRQGALTGTGLTGLKKTVSFSSNVPVFYHHAGYSFPMVLAHKYASSPSWSGEDRWLWVPEWCILCWLLDSLFRTSMNSGFSLLHFHLMYSTICLQRSHYNTSN